MKTNSRLHMSTTVQAVDIDGQFHKVDASLVKWRPSVYAVVIHDGKILLSPQHGENRYDLPGGGIDMHESIEQALVREVKEETGIDVEPGKLLTVRDNFFKVTWREPQDTFHSLMLYYSANFNGGELSTAGFYENEKQYAQKAVWLPVDQLNAIEPAASFDWRDVVNL